MMGRDCDGGGAAQWMMVGLAQRGRACPRRRAKAGIRGGRAGRPVTAGALKRSADLGDRG